MDERIKFILEEVARGCYCQHTDEYNIYYECIFCYTDKYSSVEHASDCPVTIARQILKEEKEN